MSAYCHGELDAARSARVAAHLEACAACRAELAEIQRGIALAGRASLVRAPDAMWPSIVRAAQEGSAPVSRPGGAPAWTRRVMAVPAAAAAMLLVAVGAVTSWTALRPAQAWPVASLGGSIQLDGERIADRGAIPIDGRLQTDGASRATIAIGQIGQVEVEPNSVVRLAGTGWFNHRLSLERGSIRAAIFAPPRVFFVETPSATAVDLGCAFSLAVDEGGDTTLRVTSGWVALEGGRRQVFVPAGASCRTRRDSGPGTPSFDDAPPDLIGALDAIDRGDPSQAAALNVVLATARPRDTLTLWHLLGRVAVADRARVYDRLSALSPPPAGVTRDELIALDRDALDRWRRTFDPPWKVEAAWRAAWRRAWTYVLGT